MNGTSSATAMVSGVIALMLDANPFLGWRDVQDILAQTAFHTGSAFGAALPGLNEELLWYFNHANNWNGGGMHYSEDYGYGNVDAYSAVRMAEAYGIIGNVPHTSANEISASSPALNTDFAPSDETGVPVLVNFDFAPNLIIQHIDLTLNMTHALPSDLQIVLTSPEGTHVTVYTAQVNFNPLNGQSWVYGIDALHGELSAGTWTLSVLDGTVNSVQMTVFGDAPSVDDVYHYTDEIVSLFALDPARKTLADTDGGLDWINMAAISHDLTLNLNTGIPSNDGLVIEVGTVIENAITGDGNDVLTGNSASNKLYGARGNDTLNGGFGDDWLDGGTGDDTLVGGSGVNTMLGGAGDDIYYVDGKHDSIAEVSGEGTDTVVSSLLTYTLDDNVENLTLDYVSLFGLGRIGIGNELDNVILGGNGSDVLRGLAGNDRLDGGNGADAMFGGDGNDTYVVTAHDVVIDVGGVDTVETRLRDYRLADNIENLTFTGTGNFDGTGNDLDNQITGGDGNDVLKGLKGNDTIGGGGGNDTMDGGFGNDIFEFLADFGDDRILFFDNNPSNGQDLLNVAALGITAANFDNLVDIDKVGNNTLITIGDDTITLVGVKDGVDVNDFILAP